MRHIKDIIRAATPFLLKNAVGALLVCLLAIAGCAATKDAKSSPDLNAPATAANEKPDEPAYDAKDVKVTEFVLSKGDQITISVFQHDELSRKIHIPPDGKFYFPMVGYIEASGKSINDVREIIKKGLEDDKDQPLLPGDEMIISVFRQPDFSRKIVIPSNGYIAFPYMGDVKVEGRTRTQLQADIAAGISKYVNSPQVLIDITKANNSIRIANAQVSIDVSDFGGQKILVLGEVKNPGVYTADGNMSVLEAITRASGFTLDAKQDDVYLVRSGKGNKREIARLNIESTLNEGKLDQNPNVRSGDTIFVSRTFISNVDRFFDHLSKIISPLVNLESGYYIGQQIETHSKGNSVLIR